MHLQYITTESGGRYLTRSMKLELNQQCPKKATKFGFSAGPTFPTLTTMDGDRGLACSMARTIVTNGKKIKPSSFSIVPGVDLTKRTYGRNILRISRTIPERCQPTRPPRTRQNACNATRPSGFSTRNSLELRITVIGSSANCRQA